MDHIHIDMIPADNNNNNLIINDILDCNSSLFAPIINIINSIKTFGKIPVCTPRILNFNVRFRVRFKISVRFRVRVRVKDMVMVMVGMV